MPQLLKNIDILILCGGLGKRLKKVSGGKPKPMVEMGKAPFLDILINYFSGLGFKNFILAAGYKAEVIRKHYSKYRKDINITFSYEKELLGTGGAIKNASKLIKSTTFFVVNGDSFCKFGPGQFLRFHHQKKSLISILLHKAADAKEFGRVKINRDSRIIKFDEKNSKTAPAIINAGVYIFDKKIFKFMPKTSRFSLEYDFFPKLTGKRIFGYLNKGFFTDIGTPKRYFKAKKYFEKHS